ncbi:MAG: hypothetical protein E7078_10245 [Bacteroidales bacterium]|nr:hypothetical protein [Bacteroidales bacterium]
MKKLFFTLMMVLLATLAAQAADPINVAGKDCKCDKDYTYTSSDITDLKSGTITYTKSTNTLTLTNVTITRTGSNDYCIHNRSQQGLTVKFVGTCNLTSKARVIRMQCGGWSASNPIECQLVATSGSTVNLKSTGDGAIYVRDFTTLCIKGPGTFNITGNKDGAIAGHGEWNSSMTDLATVDCIKFSNVTATVTGAQSALLGLSYVYFSAGSNVTLKASNNSSYPVARQILSCRFNDNTAILSPLDATYSSNSESFVLNGSKIYNQDVFISDNYALLLNSTNFPDANFRSYMLSLYPKGYMTQSELQNLTYLSVSSKSISNMQGIEKLIYLKDLRCYSNTFTSLDLSSNTALTYLDCAPNSQLTSLSIGNCTNLETLICYSTGITSLSLSNLSKLKKLSCYNTKLTSLMVTGKSNLTELNCKNCTSLTSLICYNNALTSLDVTGNTALTDLSCYGNANLAAITGLADCTAITDLDCEDCKISDLSGCNSMTNLKNLYARNNKLTSFTLTNKPNLTYVRLNGNTSLTTATFTGNSKLAWLYISGCTSLTSLSCQNNALTWLDVTGNTALKELRCFSNSFTSLDLSSNTALTYLDCAPNSQLTSLSIGYCTNLETLICYETGITSLSLGNLSKLKSLSCYNTKLTSLTVNGKSQLTTVSAYNNPNLTSASIYNNSALTTLNIYSCPAMTTLNCYSNSNLASLNLSGNSALTTLKCYSNKLSSLDVSALTNLTRLECYSNQLTTLNVNNNTKLQYLACSTNKLTSLNVSSKTAMSYLACNGNQLTSLNVQGCSALTELYCYENKLTSLYVQGCTALNKISGYRNQITAAGMTTLVNSLPTRSTSNTGVLYVQYNTNEGNVFNASHLSTAQAKKWYPKKYNGSSWVDITFSTRGDVNGDGSVNISDVTALIDYLLSGNASGINLSAADCDQSGSINISDVTALIDYLLSGSW